jgi:2-phosphosulfolactate phosphatase
MLAALHNGALRIRPVASITDALFEKKNDASVLLAGERNGEKISASTTGSIDFDLGNSPREMVPVQVKEKTLVMTTTNGTRAIRACENAKRVLIASFGNLTAVAKKLARPDDEILVLVCSGTGENASLEDTCGAGALIHRMRDLGVKMQLADSAVIAEHTYEGMSGGLENRIRQASNARHLLQHAELADDVSWCLTIDQFSITPRLNKNGYLTC